MKANKIHLKNCQWCKLDMLHVIYSDLLQLRRDESILISIILFKYLLKQITRTYIGHTQTGQHN